MLLEPFQLLCLLHLNFFLLLLNYYYFNLFILDHVQGKFGAAKSTTSSASSSSCQFDILLGIYFGVYPSLYDSSSDAGLRNGRVGRCSNYLKLRRQGEEEGEYKRSGSGVAGNTPLYHHILHVLMFLYFSYPIGGMQT